MKFQHLFFAIMFALFAVSVQAQSTATPQVSKRQVKQSKRIGQGVKSGELTKGETKQLAKQQRRINRSKKAAKADGQVTKKERANLHARQSAASRNVARKKNNSRNRN